MIFERDILEIFWHPNTKGFFIPFIYVDKIHMKKGKEEFTYDSIPISNYQELYEREIGKGGKVSLKFDDECKRADIKVLRTSKKFQIPHKCNHCGKTLVNTMDEICCINHVCTANSRGPIYRLYTAATLDIPKHLKVLDIAEWLNNFPSNGDYSNIESYAEFLILFSQEKDKIGSEDRRKALSKRGEYDHDSIFKFEIHLLKWLNESPRRHSFWYSLNLPIINIEDRKKIYKHHISKKLPKFHSEETVNLMTHHYTYFTKIWKLFYAFSR